MSSRLDQPITSGRYNGPPANSVARDFEPPQRVTIVGGVWTIAWGVAFGAAIIAVMAFFAGIFLGASLLTLPHH